jgi:hypothetical protein
MMTPGTGRTFTTLAALAAIAGCATTTYREPGLAGGQAPAVIEGFFHPYLIFGAGDAYLAAVDGTPGPTHGFSKVVLKPGPHCVIVEKTILAPLPPYTVGSWRSGEICVTAESGHRYRVKVINSAMGVPEYFSILDTTTGVFVVPPTPVGESVLSNADAARRRQQQEDQPKPK